MSSNYIKIANLLEHTIDCLVYYDRKEDEDVPLGFLENCIRNGDLNKQDFKDLLCHGIDKWVDNIDE